MLFATMPDVYSIGMLGKARAGNSGGHCGGGGGDGGGAVVAASVAPEPAPPDWIQMLAYEGETSCPDIALVSWTQRMRDEQRGQSRMGQVEPRANRVVGIAPGQPRVETRPEIVVRPCARAGHCEQTRPGQSRRWFGSRR